MTFRPRLLVLLVLCPLQPVAAQESASPADPAPDARTLTVATKVAAPFAMKNDEGQWTGLSIELWRRVAEQVGVETRFVEHDIEGMIRAVASGEADVGVAATTVTAERERVVDFTQPFFHSGLGVAVVPHEGSALLGVLRRLFSLEFLAVVLALCALLLGVGAAIWLFERRRNAEHFDARIQGLGSGFWWSAVTMTTVGYGDKAPTTFAGRAVALVWMFASIIIISTFTAAIASALTISRLGTSISRPSDLHRVRVATVADTAAATSLRRDGVRAETHASLEEALGSLREGEVDAVVYDAPILKYTIAQLNDADVQLLPFEFDPQDYAIFVSPDSELREPINIAVLSITSADDWREIVAGYLGP